MFTDIKDKLAFASFDAFPAYFSIDIIYFSLKNVYISDKRIFLLYYNLYMFMNMNPYV